MSRTNAKNDGWVRIFEVPCFERHAKGYTVYKIVSRVFPCQCPEASTQVTVWKRFSEFKKLHAEMSSLHAALYLKGTFPPLSRTSYFNRFESAVLEERRAAIRAALQFVALHPPLFTSAPFSRFFEDGDCRTVNETDRLPPALSPQPSLTDSDLSAPLTDSDVTRAAAGDGSSPPADGDGSAPAADGLGGLDPLLPAAAGSAGGPSNLQLLSEPAQPDLLSHLNTVPSPPSGEPSLDTLSDGEGELPDLSADEWPAGPGPGPRPATDLGLAALTLDGAPEPPELPEVPVGTPPSPPASLPAPPGERPPTPPGERPPAPAPGADPGQAQPHTPAPAAAPGRAPPSPARGVAEPPAGPGPPDAGDYLLTAAEAISRAQQAESQCQWGLAFACYQDGIGALINGVQGDPSAERREAVRRKTALYIGRAEQLAALCRDEPDQVAATWSDTKCSGSPPADI